MAADMFLKLDDITGESNDKIHKSEIELLSWSWGMTQQRSVVHSRKSPNASIEDITFTHYVDCSTPPLMLKLLQGSIIRNGRLVVRRSTPTLPFEFYTISLTNILIRSISTTGSENPNNASGLIETVSLNFEKFKVEYSKMGVDNRPGRTVEAEWSIEERPDS